MDSNVYKTLLKRSCKILQVFMVIGALLSTTVTGQNGNHERKTLPDRNILSGLFQGIEINRDASQSAVLNNLISLEMNNATVLDALKEIADQTDLELVYNPILFDSMDQRLKLDLENTSVNNALWEVLNGTELRFAVSSHGQLVIMKMNDQEDGLYEHIHVQETITGRVKDAQTGEALPGVNIVVEGTTIGTTTNVDGNFELNVPNLEENLVFTYIGYERQVVVMDGQTYFDIELSMDVIAGDELVVIGYGTVRRSDITGSVASVNIDELSQGVGGSVHQLLVGKSAGANVVQHTGEPGGGFSINIRGASSITAGNEPLYVIDGVPLDDSRAVGGAGISGLANARSSRNPLSTLNEGDIESIEILKDASATAIYGSRGANGVVLITTKGGSSGNFQIDYHGYVGTQSVSNKLDLLNADDYRRILNSIIDEGGENESFRVGDIHHSTDWQNEIFRNAMVQNQDIAFSGGTDNTTYRISMNYMDQDGIMINSGFTRYTGRANVRSDLSDKINIGLNLTSSYSEDNFGTHGGGFNETAGALFAAYRMDPTLPVHNQDGTFATSSLLTNDNPVALARGVDSNSASNRTFGSLFVNYLILNNLSARVNVGGDYVNETRKSFVSDLTILGRDANGIGTLQDGTRTNWLIEGTVNFNDSFRENHRIDIVGGITYQRFVNEFAASSAQNFPSGLLGANALGLGDPSTYNINTSKTGHRLHSYLGRVNYSLFDKYLVTSTLRVDGSSRFGENNRFAVFPSIAVAWQLKEENFMQSIERVSSLKLRVSWGQSGNQEIGNYPALSTFVQTQTAIWDDQEIIGTGPSRIPNPDLKWETSEEINVGLDFGLFEDRITGSIEYFRKLTTDMLLNLPIPQETGFNTRLTNIGEIENRGLEITINSFNIVGNNFQWSTDLTLATLTNEVKNLGGMSQIVLGGIPFVGQIGSIRPGESLNSFYGHLVEGVWQDGDDFSVINDNVQPGDLKFRDVNGDGTINDQDRVILGNSFPDLTWSFANTFSYRNLSLFAFIEAAHGVYMMNGNLVETYYPINFRRNRVAEPYLNRWTPDNPSNVYPSFVNPYAQGINGTNSYTVEDASYIKLRSVRISYDLPQISNSIRSATIYLTGENLYTITDYTGLDPAINPQGNAGYRLDFNTYPSARTYMLGIRLGL